MFGMCTIRKFLEGQEGRKILHRMFFFFFGKKMFWENQCLATFEENALEELDELDLLLLEFKQEMVEPAADPARVVQINISQDLLHFVLAVSFAKDTDQILSNNVSWIYFYYRC